jgi:hypothetical protein
MKKINSKLKIQLNKVHTLLSNDSELILYEVFDKISNKYYLWDFETGLYELTTKEFEMFYKEWEKTGEFQLYYENQLKEKEKKQN